MNKLNGDYKNQLQIPVTVIEISEKILYEDNNLNFSGPNTPKSFLQELLNKYHIIPTYNEKYSHDQTTDKIKPIQKNDPQYPTLIKLDLCTNLLNYNLRILNENTKSENFEEMLKKRIPRLEKLVEKSLKYL